jgi:hypothetical protein
MIMKVTGFTNNKLKRTGLFGEGIIESDRSLDMCNEVKVCFCAKSRHNECIKQNKCLACIPQCHKDKLAAVGKKLWEDLTGKDEAKIKEMLAAEVKKCRKVTVTIER